jgi:hypothetical protein
MKRRIIAGLVALGTALGLTLITTPAHAASEPFTRGFVTTIANGWGSPIGVWASDPPGVGSADELWYPVTGTTNWTEPVAINIAAGWECEIYMNAHPKAGDIFYYIAAPRSSDYHYPVGNWGRWVQRCFPY